MTTRRSFIRGALAAAALAVSPVALNVARLSLSGGVKPGWARTDKTYSAVDLWDAGRYYYRVTKGVL